MTSAVQDTEAAEKTALEEANQLEQDAYPEVNDLVQKYYDYMSAGDVDGLASVEDQISEEEQNRILRSKAIRISPVTPRRAWRMVPIWYLYITS